MKCVATNSKGYRYKIIWIYTYYCLFCCLCIKLFGTKKGKT